jgi:hypothetical protein
LIELAAQLPNPLEAAQADAGYNAVIRLPIPDWDSVRDAEHPDREFEAHDNAYVEFEMLMRKDTKGVNSPHWVLRSLVAM